MFDLWRPNVNYKKGDAVERWRKILLKRKRNRFNKRTVQIVARKRIYRAHHDK